MCVMGIDIIGKEFVYALMREEAIKQLPVERKDRRPLHIND